MTRIHIHFTIFIAGLLLLSACNPTRHIPKGDSLYLGTSVAVKDDSATKKEKKVVEGDLAAAVLPKPNKKVLGVRMKLAFYNLAGDTSKKKGLRKLLRKVGEPPVLTSQFNKEKNEALLVNILENRGFFFPKVKGELKTKGRKTKSHFDVWTGPQYHINNVEYVEDNSQLSKDIAKLQDKTLLKKGAPYNLDLIKGERDRIDKNLKEKGYYYFIPDHVIVRVDSTIGDHKVNMYVKVKDNVPEEAKQIFYINNVFIYPNYRLGMSRGRRNGKGANANRSNKPDTTQVVTFTDNATTKKDSTRIRNARRNDTLFYERYSIVGNTKAYKPFIFTQAMQFYPGDPYNRTDQNISLNRLINIGTFKFVKNEFEPVGDNLLNVFYYLTPYPKKSLRAELGGFTKNDSRVGSQLTLSWRNRNTLRGAELFAVKASAGFETQYGGAVRRPNTYQFGIEPSLTFPRFIVPFFNIKSSSLFVPRTTAKVGYDILIRQNLYLLQSFKAGFGYQWKENVKTEHQLFPINITYVHTDTINRDTTITLNYSNLVFDGLIIGPTYQYTYNSRGAGNPHHHDFYFDGLADFSGNILGLIQGASDSNKKELFGANYAQFMKFQGDLRHYLNYGVNPNSILASRLFVGVGIPYGNSLRLPNVKQFFSGGNNSLRGFPSRLVGPGTFNEDAQNRTFIETSGDIKLELNTEIRAQIYSFIHGAIFVDAGNVWMRKDRSLFGTKGLFDWSTFINEVAVSTGVGLRFDFKILVLRLDLGMPIRKPWLTGNKWVFDKIALADPAWKKENLILNLGIGYPF